MVDYLIPYQFVPIKKKGSECKEHIRHNTKLGEKGKYTGVIKCSLYALTPLIVGNERDSNGHTTVKPLIVRSKGEEYYLISKHSLRGMIANVYAALSNCRMDRVKEDHYMFRPLLQIGGGTIKFGAGILRNNNGRWQVTPVTLYYWYRDKNEPQIADDKNLKYIYGLERPSDNILHSYNLKVYEIYHGEDNRATLAKKFFESRNENEKVDRVGRPRFIVYKETNETIDIGNDIINHYNKTTEALIEYSTKHPLFKANKNKSDKEEEKREIESYKKGVEDYRNLNDGDFIFFEYIEEEKTKRIITFGKSFRYKWLYKDSIHKKEGKLRDDLGYEEEEKEWYIGNNKGGLNPVRRLFGTVWRKEWLNEKPKNIKRKAYKGRVSFNNALYIGGGCIQQNGTTLKILGQPRPSSWECYIRQDDPNKIKTWGMDGVEPDDRGDLAGRKFYLHNPDATFDDQVYSSSEKSDQNCTVTMLFKPETGNKQEIKSLPHFKFTIHFDSLEKEELEALLFAIDLGNRLYLTGKSDNEIEKEIIKRAYTEQKLNAHKIGAGRPLGLGSVVCVVDSISTFEIIESKNSKFPTITSKDAKLNNDGSIILYDSTQLEPNKLKSNAKELLKITEFKGHNNSVTFGYPMAKERKGDKLHIYEFHTQLKSEYHKLRRKKETDNSEKIKALLKSCLKPADEQSKDLPTLKSPPSTSADERGGKYGGKGGARR